MATAVDIRGVVKHIVDGTFDENLCRVCLLPFGDVCENIFTTVCKGDQEFCVADVLKNVCQIQFSDSDKSNICSECFTKAVTVYKFYRTAKYSEEILNFYIEDLERSVFSVELPEQPSNDSICITLPDIEPHFGFLDIDPNICTNNFSLDLYGSTVMDQEVSVKKEHVDIKNNSKSFQNDDDNIVVVVKENGEPLYYKMNSNSTLELVSADKNEKIKDEVQKVRQVSKLRKKRDPMVYRKCSKCPVKYRFIAKLKEHMKTDHNIDLFVCKVCKATYENELEFNVHLKTHTNILCCHICNAAFKKRDTIIAHLQWHEETDNMSQLEGAHVCELCGVILPDEERLQEHNDTKHDKKYTCYYCGRMYKGEHSFEMHIKKHELKMKPEDKRKHLEKTKQDTENTKSRSKQLMCSTCGKYFVDERALMWHTMLHTNERPFKCDTCGRGFVSANRRNQHSLCAHSVPTRRCPLCPALFHLTSMVNTHIKKVHLKAHKRRNRASKHLNVYWRTEAVPIQELSVDIQNELLELQAKDAKSPVLYDTGDIDWTTQNPA
ncbi:zinc finger protein 879-like [Hyposmocoma kahamanoa]|uniref:zinc finger protein 879-like n=1 Tax=Hyposmocoma kahamanoa TaxID=1477025 RepID=UPI000E6D6404|nr:zinc finger protein 879-like [Hyposmocoma kahamanoa]